jgi:hypothetical protein
MLGTNALPHANQYAKKGGKERTIRPSDQSLGGDWPFQRQQDQA